MVEQDKATVADTAGEHCADVFRWNDGASGAVQPFSTVSLVPDDIDTANSDVLDSYTWKLAISAENSETKPADAPATPDEPATPTAQTALDAFNRGDPPPTPDD